MRDAGCGMRNRFVYTYYFPKYRQMLYCFLPLQKHCISTFNLSKWPLLSFPFSSAINFPPIMTTYWLPAVFIMLAPTSILRLLLLLLTTFSRFNFGAPAPVDNTDEATNDEQGAQDPQDAQDASFLPTTWQYALRCLEPDTTQLSYCGPLGGPRPGMNYLTPQKCRDYCSCSANSREVSCVPFLCEIPLDPSAPNVHG